MKCSSIEIWTLMLAAAGSLLVGCHDNALEPVVDTLQRSLKDGTVIRMRVNHVPYFTISGPIQPYQMHDGGLEISSDTVPGPFESLSRALQEVTATPVHHPPDVIHGQSTIRWEGQINFPVDVRWSCILYDKNGNEIGSIFLGRRSWWGNGNMGIVNGKLLNLNGVLSSWFEDNFLKLFDERFPVPESPSPSLSR